MTRWDVRVRCPECGVARVEEWEGTMPPHDLKVASECDNVVRPHEVLQASGSVNA